MYLDYCNDLHTTVNHVIVQNGVQYCVIVIILH